MFADARNFIVFMWNFIFNHEVSRFATFPMSPFGITCCRR